MTTMNSMRDLCTRLLSTSPSAIYRTRTVQYQPLWSRYERGTRPRWSHRGEYLCVDRGIEIALLQADSGSLAHRLGSRLHTNACWLHDDRRLVLPAFDTIDLWDSGGRIVRRWLEPQVRSVASSVDDRLLAIADPSKITLMDFDDNKLRVSFANCYQADDIALSPDGRYLAGSGDFGLGLWDIHRIGDQGHSMEHGPAVGNAWCERPVFSPDGSRLAARARGRAGALLVDMNQVQSRTPDTDWRDERLPTTVVAEDAHVRDLAWLSNDVLAIATQDGVQAWRCARGTEPERLGRKLPCNASEIASNPKRGLLAVCDGKTVSVWHWSGIARCSQEQSGWSGSRTVSAIRKAVAQPVQAAPATP